MAESRDVKKLVEDRIFKIDDELEELEVGTKEHVLAVSDLKKMVDSWSNLEERRITEEDNVAKREEQKRMNEEEMAHRETMEKLEYLRYEADKAAKWKQLKLNCIEIGAQSLIGGFALLGQTSLTRRAMVQEYGVSNGNSLLPPKNIDNQLRRFDPFIKKR